MFEQNFVAEHECDICGKIAMCSAIDVDMWACEECAGKMEEM